MRRFQGFAAHLFFASTGRSCERCPFSAGGSIISHDGLLLVVPVLGVGVGVGTGTGILAPLLVVPLLGPEMAASFPPLTGFLKTLSKKYILFLGGEYMYAWQMGSILVLRASQQRAAVGCDVPLVMEQRILG